MTQAAASVSSCSVLMGVSACGKSTVGRSLAERLGGRFVDGDDHHPSANLAKMTAGIPLTDADRQPWLDSLHRIISEHLAGGGGPSLVVACSTLRRRHRDRLRGLLPTERIRFVHLAADFTTILARLDARRDHFMRGRPMLENQFAVLEPLAADELAAGCIVVDATLAVEAVVERVMEAAEPRGRAIPFPLNRP